MAEDYGYGYGRYPDDYDDEYVYNEAGYDHADEADHDDYGYEEDTQGLTDEAVDDAHLLNGAMSEPVSYVPEDPTEAVESASYERIGRFKILGRGGPGPGVRTDGCRRISEDMGPTFSGRWRTKKKPGSWHGVCPWTYQKLKPRFGGKFACSHW